MSYIVYPLHNIENKRHREKKKSLNPVFPEYKICGNLPEEPESGKKEMGGVAWRRTGPLNLL